MRANLPAVASCEGAAASEPAAPFFNSTDDNAMFKPDGNLQRIYNRYNRLYFHGELPRAEVGWNDELGDKLHGLTTVFHQEEGNLLYFNVALNVALKEYDKGYVRLILLHEMCHVKLYPYMHHGRRFQDAMKYLANNDALKGIW